VEVPAGIIEPGEKPEDCIVREIEEETGYGVDSLKWIAEGYVSPGYTTEMITIYFAEVNHKTGKGGGVADEDEEVEIIELSHDEMLATAFNDFKTIIAVSWVRNYH
jgi:nudix-type nucleoside diphosphatase (YffH/AdpP family)